MALQAHERVTAAVAGDPKAVGRRLIDEVMNGGDLAAIDELYAPDMAAAAHRWIEPFRESSPTCRWKPLS